MRALALLAALLVPSIAAADADKPAPTRYGVMGGLALHGGNISCDGDNCGDTRKAGGASGHIGWMLNEKMGILLDVWGMTSEENNVKISYVTGTVNFRYYPVPILWVQGGLGNGHAIVSSTLLGVEFKGQSDDVPVGQLAAGLEIVRGPRWALDVQAKVAQGTGTDDNNAHTTTGRMASLAVGFTWFGSR